MGLFSKICKNLWRKYRINVVTIPVCLCCYGLCRLIFFFEMPSTRSTDEFNAVIDEKDEEFKLALIEQVKSNLRELFKDQIRQIIKEEEIII